MTDKKDMKKVLLTGGAGYIGSTLAPMLLDAGYEVVLFDCFFFGHSPIAEYESHPRLTIVEGDIQDTDSIAPLLERGMDVIHLASLSNDPPCDLDPKWSSQVNHYASIRLADEAKKRGVSRFVFASSCSVYGFGGSELLKENSLCNPVSVYAQLKMQTEEEIRELASPGFCPVFLRQATIYGLSPRMRFDLAINQMTMHAITRGKIFVMGGGKQWRPFMHVRDAARLFLRCLTVERSRVYNQTFNAGSTENNFSIAELAEKVAAQLGNTELVIAPDDDDKRSYNVDFTKAEVLLNWKPTENISKGINEIADFVKANINKDLAGADYFNIKRLQSLAELRKTSKVLGLP